MIWSFLASTFKSLLKKEDSSFKSKRRDFGMAQQHITPRNSDIGAFAQRGYLIGKKIGEGTHAAVHYAEFISDPKKKRVELACKIFDMRKISSTFFEKFFPRELEILTRIENPHIIQVHSIFQRDSRIFVFMRYAPNGDLLEFLLKHKVSEEQSKIWFRQITSGLHYLHKQNIAHRDLKCENILLSRRFNAKIADFGFSRYCVNENGCRVLSETYCGSRAYSPPEIVCETPYNAKLADVWSLGVILYIMLNGVMPFKDKNTNVLLRNQIFKTWLYHPKLKENLSDSVKDLLERILEPDITLRLTLDQVISHEWLQNKSKKKNILPLDD